MGRPSKQKQVADKYFKKRLIKKGKLDSYDCTFCFQTFAYNSWRMAKHLVSCTKTTLAFQNSDLIIIKKLFKNDTTPAVNNDMHDEYFVEDDGLSGERALQISSLSPQKSATLCSINNLTASQSSMHSFNSNTPFASNSSTSMKTMKIDRFIDRFINQDEQAEIWKLLAKACYATGTPLSFTENVYFQEVFKKIRPCLQLPSRYQLSNNLLNSEYNSVEKKVHDKVSSAKYLSIQLDGWTNIRSEAIVNVILTTPEPVVYEVIETGIDKHTGIYMASIIEKVVNKVGSEKVISVVSDNAKNMVKAWDVFLKNHPSSQISFFGCAAHILNLLCKDIINLPAFRDIQNSSKGIIKQFKYSHILSGLLKQFQTTTDNGSIQNSTIALKLPVATRWGSEVESFGSLLKNKQYLKQVAISDKAVNLLSKESGKNILDNTLFWVHVEIVYNLLKPIANWITILESETCSVSVVVKAFNDIQKIFKNQIQTSSLLKKEEYVLLQKVENRKCMAVKGIHLAGHLLDPRYKGECFENNESIDAAEFVSNLAEHLHINIPDVMSELAEYKSNCGLWSKPFVWDSLKTRTDGTKISSLTWWKGICNSAKLSTIAIAILECSPTSASTERSFSTYGFVHTAKRNRLTNERAAKLVYIKHNLKIDQGLKKNKNFITPDENSEHIYDEYNDDPDEVEECSSFYPSDNEFEVDELFSEVVSSNH